MSIYLPMPFMIACVASRSSFGCSSLSVKELEKVCWHTEFILVLLCILGDFVPCTFGGFASLFRTMPIPSSNLIVFFTLDDVYPFLGTLSSFFA